jgi:hypothetical protein
MDLAYGRRWWRIHSKLETLCICLRNTRISTYNLMSEGEIVTVSSDFVDCVYCDNMVHTDLPFHTLSLLHFYTYT